MKWKFEVEGWSLKLKFEVKDWRSDLKLKFEAEVLSWSLKLEIKVNTPTGAATNPKNFDSNKNLNLIGT